VLSQDVRIHDHVEVRWQFPIDGVETLQLVGASDIVILETARCGAVV
jgi:hypothetical protein